VIRPVKALIGLALVLAACTVAGESLGTDRVLRLSDGAVITFGEMVQDLKTADLVFVGELHDNAGHHQLQLGVIQALHEAEDPLAIGLEMFRAESQHHLDRWIAGKKSLDEFLPVWYDNWRLPWPLYRDIFLYSREHAIPMLGLNVPGDITRKVARQGFASLTPGELKNLPPGISCNVDPKYREFISRAYSDDGHVGEKNFNHFCEAQMVWDKTMAWHLVRYSARTPGATIVVLAGIGHAWKPGIPAQVRELAKRSFRVVLPAVDGRVDKDHLTVADADYLVLE
jgi:uncharacterized iron-regulated protein